MHGGPVCLETHPCFCAGEGEEGKGGPGLPPKSYVLKPVDGQLAYLRRGREVRASEDEAIQEADLALDALSLHLSSALLPPCPPACADVRERSCNACTVLDTAGCAAWGWQGEGP